MPTVGYYRYVLGQHGSSFSSLGAQKVTEFEPVSEVRIPRVLITPSNDLSSSSSFHEPLLSEFLVKSVRVMELVNARCDAGNGHILYDNHNATSRVGLVLLP